MKLVTAIKFGLVFTSLLFWGLVNASVSDNTEQPAPPKASSVINEPPALEPVSLQLKWLHQFQFAGYYAAKIKGFYEQEGLDVTIKQRELFANNIDQVAQGESEYGVADSMMLLYISKGAPLSIVAPIFQHSPQVFITLRSSGIDSLYGLEGKNIAFYNKDTDGFPLLAMMNHNGVSAKLERTLIKVGPESLLTGRVQAYPAYLSNEPYFFKQKDIKINTIKPINYGVDLYGDLLFTNKNELKNHPDRVERFKRASIKGWYYALQHKEEIIDYLINELGAQKTREHLLYEANVIEEAIQPNSSPIGTIDKGRLQYIEKLFLKHNLLSSKIDLDNGIYQKETHLLNFSDTEIDWLKTHQNIKVAIDSNWAPIEFVDKQGRYQGIANEYLGYLTDKTGIQFIPAKELSWEEAVLKTKTGELDMFSAVIHTAEREKYLNFTQPYLKFPMVISTLKGQNFIKDLNTLDDATIAVVQDYAAEELLKKHYPKLNLLRVKNAEEGLVAVSQSQAFGYIDNIAVVGFHIKNAGLTNLQISGETPFSANVAMAIRKDWPELQSIIQKTFDSMDSQTQLKLNNAWLQVEYKKQIEWQRLMLILIPVSFVIMMILLYNRRLKTLNNQLSQSNDQLLETQADLEQMNQMLELVSTTDFLTTCFNRKHIDKILEEEASRSFRYNSTLTILMIDLDNFKQVNDMYGHLVGDEVLIKVAKELKSLIRISDTLGRWGGEEFMLICPSTNSDQALNIANKVLDNVRKLTFSQNFSITLSIGLASLREGESLLDFVARADSYLYKAKGLGKDQVISSETEEILL